VPSGAFEEVISQGNQRPHPQLVRRSYAEVVLQGKHPAPRSPDLLPAERTKLRSKVRFASSVFVVTFRSEVAPAGLDCRGRRLWPMGQRLQSPIVSILKTRHKDCRWQKFERLSAGAESSKRFAQTRSPSQRACTRAFASSEPMAEQAW
jgi:hypothetical protein